MYTHNMKTQNYTYQITKQRTSQSLHTRGVESSFKKLNGFLNKHTYGIEYGKGKVCYFAWVRSYEEVDEAKILEQKLFNDLNPLLDQNQVVPQLFDDTRRILEWQLYEKASEYISYVDNLNISPVLSTKPVVKLVFQSVFWLNEVPQEESLKSSLTAWLSPSSNSIDLYLNFPPSLVGQDFKAYKERLQEDCPIKIEDKYLHLRSVG